MTDILDGLITRSENWRALYFRPFLKLCVRLGVSANQLTVLRLGLALPFPWMIISYPRSAWILLALSILADAFDGTLARYTKTENDRGKFIDVLTDQLTFVLLCFGLIRSLPGLTLPLSVSTVMIPATYLICMIAFNEKRPSDWLIKAEARLTMYKIIFLLLIVGHYSWWSPALSGILIWTLISIVSLHFMWRFLKFVNL